MEDLGRGPDGLGKGRQAGRRDHELLEVDAVVGMGPAVEDVDQRDGKRVRIPLPQGNVERQAGGLGRGIGRRHRNGQDGVGPQVRLQRGPVERQQEGVDPLLVPGVIAAKLGGDDVVDVGHGFADALAQEAGRVIVAQLERFMRTGRSPGRDEGFAYGPALQDDLGRDGRVAPRIEDLAGLDFGDSRVAHEIHL